MSPGAAAPPPAALHARSEIRPATHAVIALLTMLLVAAFMWWRLGAQRNRVEGYWERPLVGSARGYRVRADESFAGHEKSAEILATLAARGRGPGSAFEQALAAVLADGDVPFVSLRDGNTRVRCSGVPLATHCVPGSAEFDIPSPTHPQASRVRPLGDGRVLVPVVAAIPAGPAARGGVLTIWMDPEVALLPRLLRMQGTIAEATTTFLRRGGDSSTILTLDRATGQLVRMRTANNELPSLFRGPPLDSALVAGADGGDVLAAHIFIPRLRWHVYRVLTRADASAPFRRQTLTEGILAFILGSLVIGAIVATVSSHREQRVRAELLQAQVESLQAQLRPHFMFNALNTIATLVHENPDAADRMLVRLADLLRLSLEHSDEAEISLRSELEILDAYLAVEHVRFGDALRITKSVDPDALEVPVPRWILQPLAENAIKHGAAYTRGEISMTLTARRLDDVVEISLTDDGPNAAQPSAAEGIGLRNTRARLVTLYGEDASLRIGPAPVVGTEVVVRIPLPAGLPLLSTAEHAVSDAIQRRAFAGPSAR